MSIDKIDMVKEVKKTEKFDKWADDGKPTDLRAPNSKRETVEDVPLPPEYKTLIDTTTLNQTLDNLSKIISQTPLEKDEDKIDKIRKFINNDMTGAVKAKKSTLKTSLFKSDTNKKDAVSIEEIAKLIVDNDIKKAEADNIRDSIDSEVNLKHHELYSKMYSVLLKNDSFNKNITSMYYKKSLEYQFMHLMTSRMILDSNRLGFDRLDNTLKYIVKNTAMPEYVKTQTFEAVKDKARSRLAEGALDMANDALSKDKDDGDGVAHKKMSKTNSLLMTLVGANIVKALGKTELGKDVMEKFKNITDNPSSIFRAISGKIDPNEGRFGKSKRILKSGLSGTADLIGSDDVDLNLDSLNADVRADGKYSRQVMIAQTEVVPGLLSKLLNEVTMIRMGVKESSPGNELSFDYRNREFVSKDKLHEDAYKGIVNKIRGGKKSKNDTDLARLILNKSRIPYKDSDVDDLRVSLVSYISSGGVFKNGIPDEKFFSYMDTDLSIIARTGLYNITSSDNPNMDDDLDTLNYQFNSIRSELPNISKIVNTEVDKGNTEALVKNGLLSKVDGKYVLNTKKYLDLLESREIAEDVDVDDVEKKEDDLPKGNSFKDRLYRLASKAGILGKPITNKLDNMTISNYIDNMKDTIGKDSSSDTVSILRENIYTLFERLGVVNYISKELTPTELIEIFSILDKTANDNDIRGRLLVYLHSKNIIDGNALRDAILNYDKDKSSSPIDNMKKTLKGMATVHAIETVKENREEADPNQLEKKEDARIEKIVSAVLNKVEEKKSSDDTATKEPRLGSWMQRKRDGDDIVGTKIGQKADELAKNKPTPEGGGMLGKIFGLLGMALPAVLSLFSGIGDKIGFIWDLIKPAGSFLLGLGTNIISGIGGLVTSAIGGIGSMISGGFTMLTNALGGLMSSVKDLASAGWDKAKEFMGFGDDVDVDVDDDDKDKKKKKNKKNKGKIKVADNAKKTANMASKTVAKNTFKSGAKVAAKGALKAVPGAGILVGGAFAAKELAEGNYGYAAGEMLSGLFGSIPVVGTAVSLGISAGMEWLKSGDVDVDKNLYNGATYPDMESDEADKLTLSHIRKHETGSAAGKYATTGDIGDGAGISFGAYQLTEKSGNLKEYVKRLVAITNDPVGREILDEFGDTMFNGSKKKLISYLKETGDTNAGRYVQDSMYKELFLDPAKKLASQFGITDKASISQIVDHSVNAGLGGAKRMIQRAAGNYSPENIARARKEDYNSLIQSNPALSKYRNNWYGRVDSNAEIFTGYKPDPNKPATDVNNKDIVPMLAEGIPPVDPNKLSPEEKIKQEASAMTNSSNTQNTTPTNNTPAPNNKPSSNPYNSYQADTGMGGGSTPTASVAIDTTSIEKAISSSNKYLESINSNTTNLASRQGLLLAELIKITGLLSNANKVAPAPKTTTPAPFNSKIDVSKGATVK